MTMRPPMYVYDAPPPPGTEDAIGRAGEPLWPGAEIATHESLVEALQTIYDPEIPVNIYDLGLIYDLTISPEGTVTVQMTLTAPACPVAEELPQQVANVLSLVKGTGEVTVSLTWDPPWTPERMTEVARVALDMF